MPNSVRICIVVFYTLTPSRYMGSKIIQVNTGGPVGTQTRTRSDRKYSIPERARRAIINYLSRYKTLRISVHACPPVQSKPGTVGQKYPP